MIYAKKELELGDSSTKYDYFGLALTLCALHNRGHANWTMHPFPRRLSRQSDHGFLKSKVSERQEKARMVIENSGSQSKEKWQSWLDLENENQDSAKIMAAESPSKKRKATDSLED